MVLPKLRAATIALVCIAANHGFSGMVHAQSEQFGPVEISGMRATPSAEGASSKLFLTISNDGPDDVHLLQVTTPAAMNCSVVFESRPGVSRNLESVAIRSDEAIAFGGSFLWIKLGGLAHDLDEGDRIPVTLHFLNGYKVTILVPVEPAPVAQDRHWLRLL